MRFITIPIRALGKARDFYVRIITDCAQRVSYGGAMGIQSGPIHNLPKSFSVSFSWMATVGGNVESAAVPTSVLVRVAHELLQAGHQYLDM
ncbi:hypothetical protein LOK49_LG03G01834 [Camellia lanceoleosa]|uniref:Uncharacterized protein n=1 Tax=Camellia lanceoleosa TaxID=1840588 RepID=A0ACC0IBX1_9ERIC|nr:hypothetical protein LOK49_LG03G01834 [Camellia lanceoleosa]